MSGADHGIPFPTRLKAAAAPVAREPSACPLLAWKVPLVDHDGALHPFAELLREVIPTELCEVEVAAPRSAQETWDEVVRRWPSLAAKIAAGAVRARQPEGGAGLPRC